MGEEDHVPHRGILCLLTSLQAPVPDQGSAARVPGRARARDARQKWSHTAKMTCFGRSVDICLLNALLDSALAGCKAGLRQPCWRQELPVKLLRVAVCCSLRSIQISNAETVGVVMFLCELLRHQDGEELSDDVPGRREEHKAVIRIQ